MMPVSDLKVWAKEEIMDAIDAMIRIKCERGTLDLDDLHALQIQRERVAKFLGESNWKRK